jgi:hypothetical protein
MCPRTIRSHIPARNEPRLLRLDHRRVPARGLQSQARPGDCGHPIDRAPGRRGVRGVRRAEGAVADPGRRRHLPADRRRAADAVSRRRRARRGLASVGSLGAWRPGDESRSYKGGMRGNGHRRSVGGRREARFHVGPVPSVRDRAHPVEAWRAAAPSVLTPSARPSRSKPCLPRRSGGSTRQPPDCASARPSRHGSG